MTVYSHCGTCGDIIYSIPTMRALMKNAGEDRAQFNILTNRRHSVPDHPFRDVLMTHGAASKFIPLLEYQTYVSKTLVEEYVHNCSYLALDVFRDQWDISMSQGSVSRYSRYTFGVTWDLSKRWISAPVMQQYERAIVVNRSMRYPGRFRYEVLQDYNDVIFVGLPDEYLSIKEMVPKIQYCPVSDYLELAMIIASCRLFVGNQSFAFALAEALKVDRILEVCPGIPNVFPEGGRYWELWYRDHSESVMLAALEG